MQRMDISPNRITFACVLKACSRVQAVHEGSQIHAEIVRRGLLADDTVLGTALVDMYTKCGDVVKAHQAFNELPVCNVYSWTSLISGYAQQDRGEEALACYLQLQNEGFIPNSVTLICTLQACGSLGEVGNGKRIHAAIVCEDLIKAHDNLGIAVVNLYLKCGVVVMAEDIFNKLSCQNKVAFNTMICGFSEHGKFHKALDCFRQMQCKNIPPDVVTYTCVLKACGNMQTLRKGRVIHAQIIKHGLLSNDAVLGNALVDFYAKCGDFSRAKQELDELLVQDVASWNVLIAAYTQKSHGKQALACFEQMQAVGIPANTVTFLCILQACGSIGALGKGRELHSQIMMEGLLEKGSILGVSLVNMYGRCGAITLAQEVFDKLPDKHVGVWTALMTGYGLVGKYSRVFTQYKKMMDQGIIPSPITFTVILNVCSRLGSFQLSQTYFTSMSENYGIVPVLEHYACIVNLLGHLGHFDKVMALIEQIPLNNYFPAWISVLSICGKYGHLSFGSRVFKNAVLLQKSLAVASTELVNI
ncbi:hypothetical protein KP509_1Z090200 [Ceratopteris richardii]|nr:hypothetical protein KP509_1Z090200 [Ceratopteris richardii]